MTGADANETRGSNQRLGERGLHYSQYSDINKVQVFIDSITCDLTQTVRN